MHSIRIAVLLLTATLALPVSVNAQLSRVDELVQQFMSDEQVAGLSVAVMKDGRIVHARGYGYADLENGVPATETTVFRIASLSKQFTAMSIMILAEQGLLKLEDDITTYYPDFPTKGHEFTISQLISHVSGMNFDAAWRNIAPPETAPVDALRDQSPATLESLFKGTAFEYAPGERFRYNNNAYEMAGLLIERVSGMSYAAFLQKHIFEPLGMSQTYYLDVNRVIRQRANGYTERDGERVNAPPYTMNVAYSAGALGSTVVDLMKWQRALLENRLVSAATYRRMTTNATLNDGTVVPYGYGFFLLNMEGRRKIEHYGNIGGFRAQLAYYPEANLHVTVLANTNPARTEVLESRIARAMMDIPETQITEISIPADQLERFAGSYVVDDAAISHRSGTTRITFRDNNLYAGQLRLRPVGGNVFVPEGDAYHRYTFSMRNGRPAGLRVEREGRVIVDAARQ